MEGTKVKAVTLLITFLSHAAHGQFRAVPGPLCWYANKCEYGASDGLLSSSVIDKDDAATDTFDKQVLACHNLCVAEALCTDFTLNSFRNQPTCYLLSKCTPDTEDNCLEQGTCKSGPKDCASVPDNAQCPQIDPANTAAGNIHWQCTDINGAYFNGYTAADISAGSTCVLRCESWEATDGSDGYLESTCQPDGSWSPTMASDGEAALIFPPQDTTYPTPAEAQPFECGCKSLDVIWPLGDGVLPADQYWYDPNEEVGTDFVCSTSIDTANDDYIITTDNTCILFCDSHLVADVRCINGEWTGQPELGFWCYAEPALPGLGPIE